MRDALRALEAEAAEGFDLLVERPSVEDVEATVANAEVKFVARVMGVGCWVFRCRSSRNVERGPPELSRTFRWWESGDAGGLVPG